MSGLAQPREGHAATMLPDGSVLISGGVAAQGQPATAVELFDPAAGTFVQIAVQGAAQRSGHTATVLTDGRVLVVGGLGPDGQPRRDAELWTLGPDGGAAGAESPRATSVPGHLSEGRARHRATLLPDGRVLIEGGGPGAEAFDLHEQQFRRPRRRFRMGRRRGSSSPFRPAAPSTSRRMRASPCGSRRGSASTRCARTRSS